MNYFDYEVDQSGNKRIVFLRAIIEDSKKLNNSNLIYINPTVFAATLRIPLEVIESVLAFLEGHGYIEIDERPNHRLTATQRAHRDDEEDYYVVTLNDEFFAFYNKVEEVAPFLNANADIAKLEKEQTILASIRLENDIYPVVTASNATFMMPKMVSGSPLELVTHGLAHPQTILTLEYLKGQKIIGLTNLNETLRKTLFGKDGPLACFVSSTTKRSTFYRETYINSSQLNDIRKKATSVSE